MSRYSRQRETSNLLAKSDKWDAIPGSPSSGITDKFSLAPDPSAWGSTVSPNQPEPDDYLHNPEVRNGKVIDRATSGIFSGRGLANLGCLAILGFGTIALFGGYPVASFINRKLIAPINLSTTRPVNGTGQIASIGNFGLIDLDTPQDAYTITSLTTGKPMKLIFSDEFNVDGRTFYPGDDPYWEAVDLHYWSTNNMEWYDPRAVKTGNGSMQITLDAIPNHGLDYTGGMVATWNKFCYTGGLALASVRLPGANNVLGLWPAFWTMGNLGRAGFGASLEGMWPYTYDACDVGAAPNQTVNGLPEIATTSGDKNLPYNGELSYLNGQRLSRCTCPGESHPGPMHEDGSYVGRAAPEIDVFEAQIEDGQGAVSQSGQWAPFNAAYVWFNTSDNLIIPDPSISALNSYTGGAYQQATSVVTKTNQGCYELGGDGCFAVYAMEYKPGFDNAYISWWSDNKLAWTIRSEGLAKDPVAEIAARPVPQEPMYLLANLGMSSNFGFVDLEHLVFPTTLSIDYVRVYQYPDQINIGCDPPDFPTAAYIDAYLEAYSNPNLTTWVDDYKQKIPRNKLVDGC
ncbi:beta-glucan synthesis-associated protein [Favolaschia claudopus]|uniref:Beta-glucan synthesis-associated protein n=1 Tax=Favolaschia claudopus TaxID=2862362 RepID=A0AAW0DLR3_9AGAR